MISGIKMKYNNWKFQLKIGNFNFTSSSNFLNRILIKHAISHAKQAKVAGN